MGSCRGREQAHACVDLRRRRDWRLHCIFPQLPGPQATVIESTGLACAASGKSGGFLARDWCDGTPLAPLARRSFALHGELNEKLAGNWGYRRLDTYGGIAGFPARRGAYRLAWLSSKVKVGQALGSRDSTAQVHPGQFTAAMIRAAAAQGAELLLGRVTAIAQHHGRATGVVVAGEIIEADAVVVAMGPWSILAALSVPLPAIFGLKGHSLVFDTGDTVPGEALFVEYREPSGTVLSPEVFPRTDGTTYVCAISSETPLPIDPAQVAPDPGAIERLEAMCASGDIAQTRSHKWRRRSYSSAVCFVCAIQRQPDTSIR